MSAQIILLQEIQREYNSSIGGAIGGAIAFGALGAMIGGRAKKKEIRTATTYLIVTYEKEDSINYIAFTTDQFNFKKAVRFKKLFEDKPKLDIKTIEL